MEKFGNVVSIAFEGVHRTGKGTQIEALKEKLEALNIPCIDIRGEGSRAGKGEKPGDPHSEWWLKMNEALHKKEGEDVRRWDEAAYRLARELVLWRDRFLTRKVKESGSPFGALIVDRSLISRAALMKSRMRPAPEKIFSNEDLYTSVIQNRKRITPEMVLPDLIIELVAPKETLIARLDVNDSKYAFRKRNIEEMYETYMTAKSHLAEEIRERIVTINSSRDPQEVYAEIEETIKRKFPELGAILDAEKKDISEPDPEEITNEVPLQEQVYAFAQNAIEAPETITPVSGGLVHHVFRVQSKSGEYYIKVRGTRFVEMPSVETDPEDIRYEAKALKLMAPVRPDVFPHVVEENRQGGMLLVTSVMSANEGFLPLLREGEVTVDHMRVLGETVRDIHLKLAPITEAIRDDGDKQYYQDNLRYRLGSQNHEVLDKTIEELSNRKRQLIMGDLSPKNLGLVENTLRICDLDTAHRGNTIFDIGFFLGHLYVHKLESDFSASDFTKAFLDSYQFEDQTESPRDALLLRHIVFGTLLYRLNNTIVPYPMHISDQRKHETAIKIRHLLDKSDVGWDTIEEQVNYEPSH